MYEWTKQICYEYMDTTKTKVKRNVFNCHSKNTIAKPFKPCFNPKLVYLTKEHSKCKSVFSVHVVMIQYVIFLKNNFFKMNIQKKNNNPLYSLIHASCENLLTLLEKINVSHSYAKCVSSNMSHK